LVVGELGYFLLALGYLLIEAADLLLLGKDALESLVHLRCSAFLLDSQRNGAAGEIRENVLSFFGGETRRRKA